MRILIIGGTRFIGPAVVNILAEQGHDLAVFHRGKTEGHLPASVQHIRCGELPGQRTAWRVEQIPKFAQAFKTFAPDVVLDMNPFGEQDALVVMQTFQSIAQRIVAISSEDVYRAYGRLIKTEPGPPDPTPLTEDAPLREKLYPYRSDTPRGPEELLSGLDDYEKIIAERIFMGDPAFPGTILRLPMVYGPLDYQHRLFEYLKRMDDQRPAIILEETFARWHWTRGYVENVASAIALAVTDSRASGRIYNVGEAITQPFGDWIRTIADSVGWHGDIITLPRERLSTLVVEDIDTNQDWQVDTTRIRTELNYREPVALDEALRRTIAWERANPPEKIDPKQFDYTAEDALLAQLS